LRIVLVPAALIVLLLAGHGRAVAAVDTVPRMERAVTCSWDRPGRNPFMGDVVAAIDRYVDIPTLVRIRLKQRMQARQYDDLVDIRRDEISGRQDYEPAIRDMQFGIDRVCRQVTREHWTAQMHERGLVYCEQGHCILVPTVCRNVSRVVRLSPAVAGARDGFASAGAVSSAPALAADPGPGSAIAAAPPIPITSSYAEAVAGVAIVSGPSERVDGSGVGSDSVLKPAPSSPGAGGNTGGGGSGSSGPGLIDWTSGGAFNPGNSGGGLVIGPVTLVPEASSLDCLGVGLLLVGLAVRRQRRARRA